jgi:4-azaleucine resistance transporter AzlC
VTGTQPARVRDGLRAIAPIGVAAVLFGVSFGVLATAAGMTGLAAVVMSATTFAGSAQFAAVSVLESDGAVAAAVGAGLLLNARYAVIGLSVARSLRGGPGQRLLTSQLVVDESWAVSSRPGGGYDPGLLLGAGLGLYGAWVGGTAIGAVFGDALGDPNRLGLDAAFPALFLALLVGQLSNRERWVAAALGALVAFALVPVAPAGVPVIAAALVCLLGLRQAARS